MALDDKFEDIQKLIDTGKEKGYLTYDQVNDLLPGDIHSPDDLDDLLTTIGTQGIDVLEGPKTTGAELDKKFEEQFERLVKALRTDSGGKEPPPATQL